MHTANLIFYLPPTWRSDRNVLEFEVSADGERFRCEVPGEELRLHFGAASAEDESEGTKAFATYRDEIEQMVRDHVERHGLPPAGPEGRVLHLDSRHFAPTTAR